MRTYDEARSSAAEGSPFSNSTDGDMWMARWCERPCRNDSPELVARGEGCPLILVALEGYTPAEWLPQPFDSLDRWHCVEYRGPDEPGEPQPIPDPPDQPALWPREDFEGVRMFVDAIPKIQEVAP